MRAEAKDLKIGIFVLVALALAVVGLLAFGGAQFFQSTVMEETYVAGNVNGLEVGAPVTLRGVSVGKVSRLDFTWYPQSTPGYVRIQFAVRLRTYPVRGRALANFIQTQVSQGLRARVETQGLVGTTMLALEYVDPAQYPPPQLPWPAGQLYIPSAPSQFNQLLVSMEQSLNKLAQFDWAKLGTALDRDLSSVDGLLKHIDAINFSELGTNANGLLTELRGLSGHLQSFITDLQGSFKQLDLGKVSRNADALLLQLQTSVRQLDGVLGNLDAGSLNETLASVRRASLELEQALRELKEYPSGFIFGAPPRPAQSVLPAK